MDEAAAAGAHRGLVHDAVQQRPVLDQHHPVAGHQRVLRLALGAPVALAHQVHVGQDHGERLLARPQRLVPARPPRVRHHDGRRRHLAVPVVDEHAQRHHLRPRQEHVALGHLLRPQQRVLHDPHHRLVGLRRHHVARHHHQAGHLRLGRQRLRHVQVHLIAVEIRVVRRRHGQVEAEGGVAHHLHPVAHDGHLVQRRLPVEQHQVVVANVALHHPALVDDLAAQVAHVPQVRHRAVGTHDVVGARVLLRAATHQRVQLLVVPPRHALGEGQAACNADRHAHLVDAQVGVRRDDGAARKVDALAHQVAAHAPVLALQARPQRFERATPALRGLRHRGQLIVQQRRAVVLQLLQELLLRLRRLAAPDAVQQRLVRTHNVRVLVRQIVLAARSAVCHHRRPHRRRRHRQHRDHHPVRPSKARVEPKQPRVLV
mmetsp:Transcript_10070/g.31758  ORF Transcript_10070/g.31758 Transcript_10070/m.31758 type:complete len:430 (+) Transcript_10070:3040-4329(+)